MRAILPVLLILSGCASVPDDWTEADRRRSMAVYASLAVDAVTTSRIQDYPGVVERGPVARPILGEHPDTAETIAYMAALGLLYHFTAKRMPAKWRRFWQYGVLAEHIRATSQTCETPVC